MKHARISVGKLSLKMFRVFNDSIILLSNKHFNFRSIFIFMNHRMKMDLQRVKLS